MAQEASQAKLAEGMFRCGSWRASKTRVRVARSMKLISPQHKLHAKHAGQASPLCDLVGRWGMANVARLSKGAKYVCHVCAPAAAKHASFCEPVDI